LLSGFGKKCHKIKLLQLALGRILNVKITKKWKSVRMFFLGIVLEKVIANTLWGW
jgi:hypothetical protein